MTAVAKLPEKWRGEAAAEWTQRQNKDLSEWVRDRCHGQHARLLSCADELEAALSPAELGGVEADFDKWYGSCDARLWNNWDACKAAYIAGQKSTPRAAEAVTEYRWRSVSDDLPERTGWYIGINYGVVEPLRWDGNNWHHTRVTRDLAMPSHWRPLPAPPSAKGE